MTQRQIDLSTDRFLTILDDQTQVEVIKRWNEMYVKITHDKSTITLPLDKLALIKSNMDCILLIADFMRGIVGLNSLSHEDFDQ